MAGVQPSREKGQMWPLACFPGKSSKRDGKKRRRFAEEPCDWINKLHKLWALVTCWMWGDQRGRDWFQSCQSRGGYILCDNSYDGRLVRDPNPAGARGEDG